MQLHGYQHPVTAMASSSPGHGGIVTPTTATSDAAPARNWNDVPQGIDSATPGCSATVCSTPSRTRQSSPSPAPPQPQLADRAVHRSAFEQAPGGSRKWAIEPPRSAHEQAHLGAVGGVRVRLAAGSGCVVNAVIAQG